jgi:hypothetical protein
MIALTSDLQESRAVPTRMGQRMPSLKKEKYYG